MKTNFGGAWVFPGGKVETSDQEDVVERLVDCDNEVVLLVTDCNSDDHYKAIVDYKIKGMEKIVL